MQHDNPTNPIRVLFLGTPAFAAIPLEALARDRRIELVAIVTQPDRPVGRHGTPQPPPVKQRALALELDIPILQPETLRDEAAIAQIRALQPDIGVVAAYGEILRRAVLSLPPHGYLNIHPSLLPLYRGPTPVSGAILAGDHETGVSVMRLSAKMDAGPILAQRRVPLGPDARTGPLTDDLFEQGTALLLEVLPPYIAGTLEPTPQDDSRATYTSLLTRASGLVDWKLPAAQIERMTRAYDPWPGVTTTFRGQPLRIGRVELATESPAGMQPGELREQRGSVLVATGQGMLVLHALQPSGKRLIPAADWLRGVRSVGPLVLGDSGDQHA